MEQEMFSYSTDNVCRLCLKENLEMSKSLFEIFIIQNPQDSIAFDEEGNCFAELYHDLTGCLITEESNQKITDKVCDQCSEKLLIGYEFKKRSSEIEARIQEYTKFLEENEADYIEEILEVQEPEIEEEPCTPKVEELEDPATKRVYLIYDDHQSSVRNSHQGSSILPDNGVEVEKIEKREEKSTVMIVAKTEDGDKFMCPTCNGIYKTKKSLKKHIRIHMQDKRYKCTECPELFVHWKTRDEHFNLKHNKDGWKLACTTCGQRFYRRDKLNYHIKRKHLFMFNFPCDFPDCRMKFVEKSELKKHLLTHNTEKTYHCPICSSKYKMKKSLIYHLKSHGELGTNYIEELEVKDTSVELIKSLDGSASTIIHKMEQESFVDSVLGPVEILTVYKDVLPKKRSFPGKCVCEICGSGFSNLQNLKMHEQRHLKASISCDLCGKYFKVLPAIKAHMETVHIKQKRHKCFFCNYQNARRDRVEAHQAQHINPQPFSCELCDDRRFASKVSYECHMKTQHTDPKSYQCTICFSSFKYMQSLKRHLKRHNDGKMVESFE